MKRILTLATAIVAALAAAVEPSIAGDKDALNVCANASAFGPLKKGITVAGHDFNCHPIRVAKEADLAGTNRKMSPYVSYYFGKLSHALRLRPDDQVTYLIVFETEGSCRLKPPIVKINRGGFFNVGRKVIEMFAVRESDWRSLAKKLEGDWEATANVVILASVTRWAEQFPHCSKSGW